MKLLTMKLFLKSEMFENVQKLASGCLQISSKALHSKGKALP